MKIIQKDKSKKKGTKSYKNKKEKISQRQKELQKRTMKTIFMGY